MRPFFTQHKGIPDDTVLRINEQVCLHLYIFLFTIVEYGDKRQSSSYKTESFDLVVISVAFRLLMNPSEKRQAPCQPRFRRS